ncbi:hypothetical protein [Mesorhizobium sp.]|uniref:hypothetical protein n=1 Tax=Mesorhizobium sp. TaxID=1871066 RepID=UPI000FE2BF93|nr:hypothetical protein [Mesorhizobium sp.]RWH67929.1 MAG: hypothetical protein EOQ84_27160 [Mesorhizobium sp.]RWL23508.1 MAG: hypothetical protein EOR58_25975 [Mesorhizobium sp.]RWL25532.1 MAG: hypothetical protein EOR63_27650 [Mesorhizobium sp.]RWL33695.1 MAG: hypothetical protein EOR59_24850 [Mesorhizobium sp.]RWL47853.1 MAG: hypothetical protein EOR62_27585 [Mesorhizobium sp.]
MHAGITALQGAGWHSTIFLSRLTQSERGAFEIIASKLVRELLDRCLNRPIKQVELVKALEAALDVAASDEPGIVPSKRTRLQ